MKAEEEVLDLLVEAGVITGEQAGAARVRLGRLRKKPTAEKEGGASSSSGRTRAIDALLSLPHRSDKGGKRPLSERGLYEGLARALDLPFRRIDPLKLDFDLVTRTIPRPFAARHLVVPLEVENDELTLATADPFDAEILESLARSTGMTIKPVVAAKSDILKIIHEFYGFRSAVARAEEHITTPAGALSSLEQYVSLRSVKEMEATDQHVVNAVDYLFSYAFDQRASDIHLEPRRDNARLRLRVDGVLHTIREVPHVIHPAMTSRIKMLARMDIAERRRPQDGRIKASHLGRHFEMRVSTLPTAFGEKAVLRIFDPQVLLQDLSQLGFFPEQLELYQEAVSQPHGIILITGPTGSGKTTTLYSTLEQLATQETNVTTIEDPIEMIHESFNQVGVQPQIGLGFAQALRHILRQDPDIIMVGEIRDEETASNAVQAALTGHLVLSSLHTNDAPGAVTRLADMGVPSYLIGSTLLTVAAQRLVRKICLHCREEYLPVKGELEALGVKPLKEGQFLQRGMGCSQCRSTGYHGRTAIFELMPISAAIRELIHDGAHQGKIAEAARREKMLTLRESGLKKISQGTTTVAEVLRSTLRDEVAPPSD